MTLLYRLSKSQRGSALMEYLMLIILVSAVIVPIIIAKFGDPFLKTMGNERQKMVTFFAQTPKGRQKPPVPASWFSQELTAKPESKQIQTGEPIGDPGNLETGELQGGQAIQARGELKGGEAIAGGQTINSGQVGTGTRRAGGRQGGAGGAGGAGGDDFFSVPGTPGVGAQKSSAQEKSSEQSGSSRKRGGGLVAGEEGSVDSISRAATGKDEKGKGGKKEESQMLADKKNGLVAAEQDVRERQAKRNFDWWLLIKVLIVLGIIALLILILLGNTRRSG